MKLIPVALLLCTFLLHAQSPKPTLSREPVGADQIAIYRDFLSIYKNGGPAEGMNIDQRTTPFRAIDAEHDPNCLANFAPAETSTREVHTFAPDAFPGNNVVDTKKHPLRSPDVSVLRHGKWVNDAAGKGVITSLFSFSEIVFDASHTHAALQHSFVCGMLCGGGGIVIYEKIDGTWKPSKKSCGDWVS